MPVLVDIQKGLGGGRGQRQGQGFGSQEWRQRVDGYSIGAATKVDEGAGESHGMGGGRE
jgi:hypothetical protein